LHVAGVAEQWRVGFDVPAAIPARLDMVEVESHPVATALTLSATFCLDRRRQLAPPLVVLGMAQPDLGWYRHFRPLQRTHPVPGERGGGSFRERYLGSG
jgi:hypothetical protein